MVSILHREEGQGVQFCARPHNIGQSGARDGVRRQSGLRARDILQGHNRRHKDGECDRHHILGEQGAGVLYRHEADTCVAGSSQRGSRGRGQGVQSESRAELGVLLVDARIRSGSRRLDAVVGSKGDEEKSVGSSGGVYDTVRRGRRTGVTGLRRRARHRPRLYKV